MALERYEIIVEPWKYGGFNETLYQIHVKVDGKTVSCMRRTSEIPPHEAEIVVIGRMTQDIIRELRKKDEQSTCCGRCPH